MTSIDCMESGDIVCLITDLAGKGILPHHFQDMSDSQFVAHYGLTKEDWFENNPVDAHVYIRKTTKKEGRSRSLIAPPMGRNSQLAVFNDEIFMVGSYELTHLPDRWCPIFESAPEVPEGGGELKPIRCNNSYSAWSPESEKYCMIPTRWDRNLLYCRPWAETTLEDFEMELLPAAPGVNGVNFRVNGGGGKTGRPKLGAGMRLYNAQQKPDFPDCHDNRYLKHEEGRHPRDADEWYVPWGEFKPKFRWHDDKVPKGSITINFPFTGIGKIITGITKPLRGRVTKPRQPYDAPEYPPYAPQQQQQTPWGQQSPQKYGRNPNYQNPSYSNPKSYDATADLMKKLMSGQTLTTEELMKLQKSHKP